MKPDCKTILPLISELIDGALEADTAWKVRMHLSVCADCAAAAKEFETTAQLMKGLPKRELSDGFDAALAARIAALGPLPARRRFWWRFLPNEARPYGLRRMAAPAAIALAGLLVIGFFGMRAPHPNTQNPPGPSAMSDNALLATCLRQHHSYVASDPLADPSAQTLATQVDSSFSATAPNASQPSQPESM